MAEIGPTSQPDGFCPSGSHLVPDDELVMISALQHYLFCPRQCALIHVEAQWSENYLTATGRVLHDRVDRIGAETRRDVHIATSLRLVSHTLGIIGVADKVEFHRVAESDIGCKACKLPGLSGLWRPFPVEYKRGKAKEHKADEVQLCAQAICLEEMLGATIPQGALFYGEPRRRTEVMFDKALRELTMSTARNVHVLLQSGRTPSPNITNGCKACSMIDICQPSVYGQMSSARRWVDKRLGELF